MGLNFGPRWPEVTWHVPYAITQKRVQKNTFMQISTKGVE